MGIRKYNYKKAVIKGITACTLMVLSMNSINVHADYTYSSEYKSGWVFNYNNAKWNYYNADYSKVYGSWQYIDGQWYVFDSEGNMITGWYKDNDKWYYLESSGEMKSGWLQDNGKIYYLYPNGSIACGWIRDGSTYYSDDDTGNYFADNTGAVVSGYVQIGGINYKLDPMRKDDVHVESYDVTKAYTTSGVPVSISYNSSSIKDDKNFVLKNGTYEIGMAIPPGIYNVNAVSGEGSITFYDNSGYKVKSYDLKYSDDSTKSFNSVSFLNGYTVKVEGVEVEIISQE